MRENTATADRVAAIEIRDLQVEFRGQDKPVRAVSGVSYWVDEGEILAVVGETGSGKSVTVLAAMGLLDAGVKVSGSVRLAGREILDLGPRRRRELLGDAMAIIFQDPSSTLNPVMRVGDQIAEMIRAHHNDVSKRDARARAVELLQSVGVPQPDKRARQFPHEYSGGMRQRAVIAMALANDPRVLVADEPTTAVDVTIQAQLLNLLQAAQKRTGAATILITHDLGVVAEVADRVVVMYAGRVVEQAAVDELFDAPRHPYTSGLLDSLPRIDNDAELLTSIPGQPPDMSNIPEGCEFRPRCTLTQGRERCATERPLLRMIGETGAQVACHFSEELKIQSITDRNSTGDH